MPSTHPAWQDSDGDMYRQMVSAPSCPRHDAAVTTNERQVAVDAEGLRRVMREFVSVTASRAPLYARLAAGASEHDEILNLLAVAPAANRMPVTFFAAVHFLLLSDPDEPLAAWYPNLSGEPRTDDPLPALLELCRRRSADVRVLISTRTPQTNEVGRSAVLMIALARLGGEVGPLAQLDVGASAGLNLLADRFGYDFDGHRLGAGDLRLACGVRGVARPDLLPQRLPVIASRLGLDREPIDLGDVEQVRWLEACVWPDQTDRFRRLRAALGLAADARPQIACGDAVADLAAAVARLGAGHPVITTSWVLNYLGPQGQADFEHVVERIGAERDLSVVSYEEPDLTPGLEWPRELASSRLSLLRIARWRRGRRADEVLLAGHPHGYWVQWLA